MSTTAVFAELVVGGLQTMTWILLVVMTVYGPSSVAPLGQNTSLGVAILIAFSYGLGVIFDRVWDWILGILGYSERIRNAVGFREYDNIDRMRQKVFSADSETAANFVQYNRSRMRVARASLFNFVLITISGLVLLAVHFGGVWTKHFLLALIGGVALCLASALALRKLSLSYYYVMDIVAGESKNSS